MNSMYKVEYLPAAREDLIEIVRYISRELCNPSAAYKLADEIIEAVERTAEFPYLCPVYIPIKPLKHEYRKLYVKHYLVLYWVDECNKKLTVARVVYARRDISKLTER